MTNEQVKILNEVKQILENEQEKKIGIVATAGSGKTFTLTKLAEDNPNKKFLYLVFNKEAKLDAQKRFPNNTKVSTLHALAFRGIFPRGLQGKELLPRYQDFDFEPIKDQFAGKVNLKKLAYNFSNKLRDMEFDIDKDSTYKIMWNAIKGGDVDYTHDAYLREFIENDILINRLTGEYDAILIDEAQDLNPMTFAMLKKIDKTQIFVGDPNQAIYAFNDCINVFNKIKFHKMFFLSQTFRCTNDIVDKANILLRKIARQDTKEMITEVEYKEYKNTAILTRTNAGMIEYLVKCMQSGEKLPYLVKDSKILFEDTFLFYDFYETMNRNKTKILSKCEQCDLSKRENFKGMLDELETFNATKPSDFWLQKFYTLEEFDEYIESALNTKDKPSMLALKNVVTNIPKTITAELSQIVNSNSYSDKNQKILTAHISKGLEYDKVIIFDDFINFYELDGKIKELKDDIEKLKNSANSSTDSVIQSQIENTEDYLKELNQKRIDELNLLYVAITRAKYSLSFLDKKLEQYCCE